MKVTIPITLATVSTLGASLLFIGVSPVHAASTADTITNTQPSKSALIKLVNQEFSGLKNSDKVLPVDGGYVHGTVTEENLVNGTADLSSLTTYDSSTSSTAITVAQAKKLILANIKGGNFAGSISLPSQTTGTGISVRFVTPPTKTYGLARGTTYTSGGFGGSGWQYAGYLFFNKSGNANQYWSVYGDSARIGDEGDMYNLYNNGIVGGTQISANSSMTVYPTDGNPYLSFYSYYPASGSYYQVTGE